MRFVTPQQGYVLARETPLEPMSIAHVLVLAAGNRDLLGAVRQRVAAVVHKSPSMRQRVVSIPLDLTPPAWHEESVFDVEAHVRPLTVPPPGTDQELGEVLSDQLRQPFDRHRALWQIRVVQELQGGRAAIVVAAHLAARHVLPQLFEAMLVDPQVRDVRGVTSPVHGGRLPSQSRLLVDGLVTSMRHPSIVTRSVRSRLGRRERRRVAPTEGSHGRPSAPVRGRRIAASVDLPLDDLRRIAGAAQVTVHDALLGVCGSAWRSRPQVSRDMGGDRAQALVVQAVWSRDDKAEPTLVPYVVPLGIELRDPLARLDVVSAASRKLMTRYATVPANELRELPTPLRTHLFGAATAEAVRTASRMDAAVPMVVTHVPGPSDLHIGVGGVRVVAHHPFGVVPVRSAVHIGAMSVGDRMCVGLVADDAREPDLAGLSRSLQEALEELVQAV